jgi:hypothetical protein
MVRTVACEVPRGGLRTDPDEITGLPTRSSLRGEAPAPRGGETAAHCVRRDPGSGRWSRRT